MQWKRGLPSTFREVFLTISSNAVLDDVKFIPRNGRYLLLNRNGQKAGAEPEGFQSDAVVRLPVSKLRPALMERAT